MIASYRMPLAAGQRVLLALPDQEESQWVETRALYCRGEVACLQLDHERPGQLEGHEGRRVALQAWRLMDALYQMRADVISLEEAPPCLVVRIVEVERIQRRRFFRVEVSIGPTAAILEGASGTEWELQLRVFNLSAGGLGARVARVGGAAADPPVEIGRNLRITLKLPGQPDPLRLRARIVRTVPAIERSSFAGEIGVELLDTTPTDRERLIRYTLQVQADYLRRGMI